MTPTRGVEGPALAFALFIGAAVIAMTALSWLSTPTHFESRMAQARDRIDKAELALARAPSAAYQANAICNQPPDQEVATLKAQLQSGASAGGVSLVGLNVGASSGAPGSTIAPITLQFEVSAPYDKVVAFIASVSHNEPEVFVDSADLSSQVSTSDLKFAGRAYCAVRP